MAYPRNIFTGPQSVQRIAELEQRMRRLERASGLGKQREYRRLTTQTELTAPAYGYEWFLETSVEVPDDGWVTFTGGADFTIPATASGNFTFRRVYGAIFETTDSSDPFYGGVQCYYTYKSGLAQGRLDLLLDPNTDTGNSTVPLPWMYAPSPGAKTYRLDFRVSIDDPTLDHIYLDAAWFGVEVS